MTLKEKIEQMTKLSDQFDKELELKICRKVREEADRLANLYKSNEFELCKWQSYQNKYLPYLRAVIDYSYKLDLLKDTFVVLSGLNANQCFIETFGTASRQSTYLILKDFPDKVL